MKLNDVLQWAGCVAVILGHTLNALGPEAYPYNLVAFVLGTGLFLTWGLRVQNRPQIVVNVVSILIGILGLFKALG